jgi:pimeloyl-ACP methyl ester carboxylesterase
MKATADPEAYQRWLATMRHQFLFMTPELGDHLVECHRRVGPLSQHRDFVAIDHFDVRARIHTLKPPLLLIRGVDDPAATPEYELEIHQAVPGSQYLKLKGCGHFPFAERPAEVNGAIDEFLAKQT